MIRLEITDPTTGKTYVPHLPAGLSFEMVRENPLFNRRGDYTYDIDISLHDPHNRAIYNHIDRLTARTRPQNRQARLLCDGHVTCDGTEVILKKEGDMLKVQILAGNSEINYLTADDSLRIREMNFGTIPSPTNEIAGEKSMRTFPDANYVFPMSIRDIEEFTNEHGVLTPQEAEELLKKTYLNICAYSTRNSRMEYEEGTSLRPMPYVLFLVEKFIELLGYSLKNNELRDERRWCRLIMVHGYETLNIAEMLPDWTAAEFLQEMETFFNCVFLLDPLTKEVEIKMYKSYLDENSPITINSEDIEDEFERDYDADDAEFLHEYEGIEYELPSGEYWTRANLDPSVEKLCTRQTASFAQVGEMNGTGMSPEQTNWKIFKLPNRDLEFVRIEDFIEETTQPTDAMAIYKRYFVNQFKPYGEGNRTTLRIVPVRTEYAFYNSVIRIHPVTEEVEKKGNLQFSETIGTRISEKTVEKMQVCFYTPDASGIGVNNDRTLYKATFRTPICVTTQDYLEDRVKGVPVHIPDYLPDYLKDEGLTLELNGEHGLFNTHFALNMMVNMGEAYKVRFRMSSILDPKKQFLINNRLFICQQLKYTYANGRQHPIVEGIFYPYL